MAMHRSYLVDKQPRALVRHTEPGIDESFASYVDRVAANHTVMLADMISRLGLVELDRAGAPAGWGVALSETHLNRAAGVLRLPPDTVSKMLMLRFDKGPLDLTGLTPEEPDSLRKAAQRNWVYFSGSHYCPHCVSSGMWKLSWKLPWSFACLKHRVLLNCDCPGCEQRAAGGRKDGWLEPTFHARVPRPGLCNNSLPVGFAGRGKAGAPCGFDLSKADAVNVRGHEDILLTQEEIQDWLDEGPTPHAQTSFQELRSLTALMHYGAEAEDLGDMPAACRQAVDDHVEIRYDAAADRRANLDGRKGTRPRSYIGTPKNPILIAALVPAAMRIQKLEAIDELKSALEPFVDRVRSRGGKKRNPWPIMKYFHFSERLELAFSMCLEQRSSFNRRAGAMSSAASDGVEAYTFSASNVPQVAPDAIFDRYFAEACTGVLRNNARRFCSMALVKLLNRVTWTEAIEALSLPTTFNRFPNRMVGVLNANGSYETLAAGLREWARELSEQGHRIDYRARREQLSGFIDFPSNDWQFICVASGVKDDPSEDRRQLAAAALWAMLTGGDWMLSPAMGGEDQDWATVRAYEKFSKTYLPKLAGRLRTYGEGMSSRA